MQTPRSGITKGLRLAHSHNSVIQIFRHTGSNFEGRAKPTQASGTPTFGCQNILSTPDGSFIGTAIAFRSKVARVGTEWNRVYEDNPREVWKSDRPITQFTKAHPT